MLFRSTESAVLRTILLQVNAMSLPVRFILLLDEFSGRAEYKYHRDITQAIRSRNFKLARRMTVEHITRNMERVIDVYAAALDKHRER